MGTLMGLVDSLHKKSVQGLQSYNNVNTDMGYSDNITMDNTFRAPKSAAMFDLTITRNTNDINADLPIPFWGALDYESNYIEVISSYLPSGVALSNDGLPGIVKSPSGKGLRFYFTQGDNVDSIDVECSQVPYVNLLRASQGSLIKMQQNKMTISNVAVQTQFSNSVYIYRNSLFGKDSTDSFTPNQFKSDLQNQNDIRTITTTYTVDQETSMVFLVKPVEGFQIGWTSYVEQYDTIRG